MTKHANLEASSRVIYEDHHINGSIDGADFRYAVFKRLGAKSKSFKNSRFDYVIFEDCYVRNCTFEDCTFIGCIFRDSQFDGSRFEGCDFKYAQFENSWFDEEILQSSCPSWDNTKRAFARSLRTNYRSLGDARLESKAAKVEIEAALSHFYKSWQSNESYYRNKYKGFHRIRMFAQWFALKASNFVWGNGESLLRLAVTTAVALLICAWAVLTPITPETTIDQIARALIQAPQVFFGIQRDGVSGVFSSIVEFIRLLLSGLFLTVIIRKWGYR